MAIDTERATRRLMDAGLEEGPATGVADLVDESTDGLATEAGLETGLAKLETRMTRNIIIILTVLGGLGLAALRLSL